MNGKSDKQLFNALTKAYTARAKLFHTGVSAAQVDLLIAEIDAIDHTRLRWDLVRLGVTPKAMERVMEVGGLPHQVFAHPDVISERPNLIAYYRNVVTISKKGIGQLLFPTDRLERKRDGSLPRRQALQLCRTLNQILSGVIESVPEYTVQLSRQSVLAEIGTELQGTWANTVGQGASKAVEQLIDDYIRIRGYGNRIRNGRYELKNGWSIVFGSEPDCAFVDKRGIRRIAIEIKGSLDVAGAQTRYGEAKKSFAKQLAVNPRCHTMYLASCFTDAVIEQIKRDGQVRDWFNLTSILYDATDREAFLKKLFHQVLAPE